MNAGALRRLRQHTRESHERLERRLDILTRMKTADGRRDLVTGFHGLHAGVEAAVSPLLRDLEGLDFARRGRMPLLDADLARLNAVAPEPHPVARPDSIPEALGLLYVLEGSTLGASVIRRQAAVEGLDMTDMSFLDPYGALTGAYWRAFLAVLERECPDEPSAAAAARGGVAGFGHAERRLCAPEALA